MRKTLKDFPITPVIGERPIISTFYRNNRPIKTNRAKYPDRAVLAAVAHMHRDDYAADACAVHDGIDGTLYAAVSMSRATGRMVIEYSRFEVTE